MPGLCTLEGEGVVSVPVVVVHVQPVALHLVRTAQAVSEGVHQDWADRVHLTPRLTGRMGGLTWIVSAHSVSHCPLDVVNNRVAVGVRCDVLTQLWPPDREKVLPDSPRPAVPAQRLRLVLRGAPRAGHGDLQTVIAELGPGLASPQSGEAFVFIYLGTTWNSSSDPERCLGTERLADRRTPSIIYWNIFGPVIFLF